MFDLRSGGASEAFGALVTFFQPGYDRAVAEKRRLALARQDIGDADPPTRVDLDAGVIRVVRPLPPRDRPAN